MRISRIWIKDWDQFRNFELDLRDPVTGEAPEKVCFIGSNGTGKTKLLELVAHFFQFHNRGTLNFYCTYLVEFFKDENLYYSFFNHNPGELPAKRTFKGTLNTIKEFPFILFEMNFSVENTSNEKYNDILNQHSFDSNLHVHNLFPVEHRNAILPIESSESYLTKADSMSETNLSDSLKWFNEMHLTEIISAETVSNFWGRLIYLAKRRQDDREKFENKDTNLSKSKAQLITEFNESNKNVEDSLFRIWNSILRIAKLEVDNASIMYPIQLNEKLSLYIKPINGTNLKYSQLSTGIRNYLFKLGHLHFTFFEFKGNHSAIFVDEPENGLYADFLYDIVELYTAACTNKDGVYNAQLFFATHNPIVAAQFKKHERAILVWNDDGTVRQQKAQAAEGDDPNDILERDFGVRNLMNKAGLKAWQRVIELQMKLDNGALPEERTKYKNEIMELCNQYNFEL